MAPDPDPRGLIAEAFRLSDVSAAECRSIFLDWALGLPPEADIPALARGLLALPDARADHPMHTILLAATNEAVPPTRRGGRARFPVDRQD